MESSDSVLKPLQIARSQVFMISINTYQAGWLNHRLICVITEQRRVLEI